MKLKDMKFEELELLSYTDLTYMILKEEKKSMNTAEVFKKICELLNYSEEDFSEKIGDYYTSLTIDKRFVMLENSEWDIRDNHAIDISLEDDEEEEEEETEELEDIDMDDEMEEDNLDIAIDDEELTDDDNDLDDLAVLDEDDMEDE